jgi:hypothetical protein
MATQARGDRVGFRLRELAAIGIALVVLICIGTVVFFPYVPISSSKRVMVDLRTLEKACEAYRYEEGKLPPDLESLVSGSKPYLNGEDAIIDPWSHRYQYDPSGPHSQGAKPDIFTVDPDGNTIGNWQDRVK